jgi:quercetin dioxygenase-like cupin family protein
MVLRINTTPNNHKFSVASENVYKRVVKRCERVRVESLINYQNGSVVSKTIIGKKTGTVTLFAFDKERGLSEHTAPYDAMVYVVDGEAQVTIDSKEIVLKKGDMVILPANKPHSVIALSQYKMLLIMVKS